MGEKLKRLKSQARRHGRSLQDKVRAISSLREANAVSAQWQKRLAGRGFRDSAQLIREDRHR